MSVTPKTRQSARDILHRCSSDSMDSLLQLDPPTPLVGEGMGSLSDKKSNNRTNKDQTFYLMVIWTALGHNQQ
jgi:hypothetical protein